MSDVFRGLQRPSRSAEADIVVGLGARAGATADEILALIDSVLTDHRLSRADIVALATLDRKVSHPALFEAASVLGVPLVGRCEAELGETVPNPSASVFGHIGITSVAEASALSFGPLMAEKTRSPNATCALSRLLPVQPSIALSTASTLSTSVAGR